MFRRTLVLSIVAAFFAAISLPAAADEKAPEPKSVTKIETLTATITAIDAAKRHVTLKGPSGNSETIYVPETMTRFSELKVGDQVTFKYAQSLVVRLQKPGEVAAGSAAVGVERGTGPRPGGTASAEVTAVVTLLSVDPKVPSVTIKTDTGDVRSFHVKDAKNLEGFKAGDKVAITYTESLAIDVSTPVKK